MTKEDLPSISGIDESERSSIEAGRASSSTAGKIEMLVEQEMIKYKGLLQSKTSTKTNPRTESNQYAGS